MSNYDENPDNSCCYRYGCYIPGPPGPQGARGPAGKTGEQGPPGINKYMLHLSTPTVTLPGFLGQGTFGPSFYKNSVLFPQGAVIEGMTISLRNNPANSVYGSIWVSEFCTTSTSTIGIDVTVSSPDCCATTDGSYTTQSCCLLSVQINALRDLEEGLAAIIYYSLP